MTHFLFSIACNNTLHYWCFQFSLITPTLERSEETRKDWNWMEHISCMSTLMLNHWAKIHISIKKTKRCLPRRLVQK